MTLVARIAVAGDVRSPLVLRGVCVPCADVLVLQGFKLLLGTKFVGLT